MVIFVAIGFVDAICVRTRENCYRVVSENTGMPLPGVSVLVKGTKTEHKQILMENFPLKQKNRSCFSFSYVEWKTTANSRFV
jgi:hypothetical protein